MERKDTNQLLKPAKIGAILLCVAVIIGVLVMLLSSPRTVKAEPAQHSSSCRLSCAYSYSCSGTHGDQTVCVWAGAEC